MDESLPKPLVERPEQTEEDALSDDPATHKALGSITLGGGAAPFAGTIAANDPELEANKPDPGADDTPDPRGR